MANKVYRSTGNTWVLVLLMLAGGLAGSALGNALAPWLPWLKSSTLIGLQPSTLDLHFFSITFGFAIALNPFTALGLILGYFLYRKV